MAYTLPVGYRVLRGNRKVPVAGSKDGSQAHRQPVGYMPIGSPMRPERDMCPEDVADLQTPVMQEIAMNLVSPSSTSFSHCLYVLYSLAIPELPCTKMRCRVKKSGF